METPSVTVTEEVKAQVRATDPITFRQKSSRGKNEEDSWKKEKGITDKHLKEILQELGLIKLCWEDVPVVDYDRKVHHSWNCQHNSEKEKLLLMYTENFRKQFHNKFPHRRPLILACENEYGIQKMVSTTIRPTTIKYSEFHTWQRCVEFVADHLQYQPLQHPTLLPVRIDSPYTVLQRQQGHCFEYSTLLTSLLIAAAYDAYVVSGYARREICNNDNSRIPCPYLKDQHQPDETGEVEDDRKYSLRPPKDLRSQFLLEMKRREVQRERDAQKAQEVAEWEAIVEFERPPPDEMTFWRLHSWVLVLPSKDVEEPFFIESVTGVVKSVADADYHGIESVWNHLNYWVLVQFPGSTISCEDIDFDLMDTKYWEHLLIGEPSHKRMIQVQDMEPEEKERGLLWAEKHLDMPGSWVDKLVIPHAVYEQKYPGSRKETHYRKCIAQLFAPYVHQDGLLTRVTHYHDYECSDPIQTKESFQHRSDLLYFTTKTMADQSVHDRFHRGRQDALKEHCFYSTDSGIECRFTFEFYHEARLDGLARLVMDPLFMTEHLEKRVDFLYYRHVEYSERESGDLPTRDIIKITEKYRRNSERSAEEDIAQVEYCLCEAVIRLKFHYEPQHVTATTREFRKPPPTGQADQADQADGTDKVVFDPSLTWGYLTGPTVPPPKPLYLYRLQLKYFKDEEMTIRRVRDRENELLMLVRLRAQQMMSPQLLVSVFDQERNQMAKQGYKERERLIQREKDRDLDLSVDFLAPYFARLGIGPEEQLTAKVAQTMVADCQQEWKTLLLLRAADLQSQFQQVSQDLQERCARYEQARARLSKEAEDEHLEYTREAAGLLQVLEVRLKRHKELAPQRYLSLNAYLRADPRLAVIYKPLQTRIARSGIF